MPYQSTLITQGTETFITVKSLTITMCWTSAVDLDLAAAYQTKTGRQGLVHFAELGSTDKFPFIKLSGDQGIGDRQGNNSETLWINALDDMDYVWIFCWDYGMVQTGSHGRFNDCDITLQLIDEKDKSIQVKVDTSEMGNVCCIATLDNSQQETKLINLSKVGTLRGLSKLEQLLNILK
ncbi:hypothetical protein [Beggiatoa leptomitoformis]|uniref:TerD domain-containing protein n=1 Tax=Beggiatoa leptomitoformis TaxID=288004 RepID=A0A2N9YDM3_9GAMM|nr:hypothetical protein [Beggiatoa leptomitoformis]ALG69005.1 hypothetical protein AL038_16560 [Beggiatoa leptomitoformis]AUI68598.1 hypothetical protein BLE401_07685 [Beggiatoa leptomitoformis]